MSKGLSEANANPIIKFHWVLHLLERPVWEQTQFIGIVNGKLRVGATSPKVSAPGLFRVISKIGVEIRAVFIISAPHFSIVFRFSHPLRFLILISFSSKPCSSNTGYILTITPLRIITRSHTV